MASLRATAKITQGDDGFSVTIDWDANVDRKNTGGWSVGPDRKLADRLAACVNAQKAFTNAHIDKDVNGKTYVAWTSQVLGRRMNADLKRLGF
jgi:hypothetical protein